MKSNRPVKILLVDHREENISFLENILDTENYSCITANSGSNALKILFVNQDFAILLIDVDMPVIDGFETVAQIRKIEELKLVPIIFVSAYADNP